MPMRKLKHLLEYILVRLMAASAKCLPWRSLGPLAGILGPVAGACIFRRRRLVKNNLRLAMPDLDEVQIEETARAFWRNITLTALEWLKIGSLKKEWVLENIELQNRWVLDEALKQGRGVLCLSGHFANWEFGGSAITLNGYPLAVLGRTQKNRYLDRWHNANRNRLGIKIFNHHQAVRETLAWLKKGGCLGIMIDHNLYKGGIFVNFFNRPAATSSLIALLHLKTLSPIVGIYPGRSGRRLFVRFEKLDLPRLDDAADKGKKAAVLTQALTDEIEEWVRRDPANWLWGHNRWKRSSEYKQ
ncbi:MAG: lysophospholipid acyltransferase family protein [Elusimicrobia bacterium]|nr:lysophospholipid acyltransferase family protein [Elusimicrobiota bacterium]